MFLGEDILKRSGSFVNLRKQTFSNFSKTKKSIKEMINETLKENLDDYDPQNSIGCAFKTEEDNKFISLLYNLSRCNEGDRIIYLKQLNDLIQENVFSTSENYHELEINLAKYANSLVDEAIYAQRFFNNLSELLEQERINGAENDTMKDVSPSERHRTNNNLNLFNNDILRRTSFFPNSHVAILSIISQIEGKVTALFDKNMDDNVLKDFYKTAEGSIYLDKAIAIENLMTNCEQKLSQQKYSDIKNLLQRYVLALDLQRLFLSKFFVNLNRYIDEEEIKIAEFETIKNE